MRENRTESGHRIRQITHSLFFMIFRNFAIVMILFAILVGVIFVQMYSTISMNQNRTLLARQAKSIADRVSEFVQDEDYISYPSFMEVLEELETNDVWILANPDHPMDQKYTNIALTAEDVAEVAPMLAEVFSGQIADLTVYSDTYEANYQFVGAPITDMDGAVCGAVLVNQVAEGQRIVVVQSFRIVSISLFIALLMSLVLGLLVVRRISIPLSGMRQTAMELADGDYSAHTGIHEENEMGELAGAIDSLADRLRLAEQERADMEQMRMDFFANVSHELRTPITVVRAYTETLLDGVVSDEETTKQYYSRMVDETKSMERLVGDLLTLSKLQNPDFVIDREPINLLEILDELVRSTGALGAERGISVRVQKPDTDVMLIYGDYDRIQQMFMVILDNAVKFSKDGGIIDVRIREEDGLPKQGQKDAATAESLNLALPEELKNAVEYRNRQILITIRDHGVGISAEELPHIFDKFYRSKLRQNAKGSGLGLAIAREICTRHDGSISVISEVGNGTTFTFAFAELFEKA